jgi:hypothetical protein
MDVGPLDRGRITKSALIRRLINQFAALISNQTKIVFFCFQGLAAKRISRIMRTPYR